jgi:hypothetical protein
VFFFLVSRPRQESIHSCTCLPTQAKTAKTKQNKQRTLSLYIYIFLSLSLSLSLFHTHTHSLSPDLRPEGGADPDGGEQRGGKADTEALLVRGADLVLFYAWVGDCGVVGLCFFLGGGKRVWQSADEKHLENNTHGADDDALRTCFMTTRSRSSYITLPDIYV